jgi:hypothetical protein
VGEHGRRATFYLLMAMATVGAAALPIAAVVQRSRWHWVLLVGGPAVCAVACTTLVVLIRHWGSERDDFWWPTATTGPEGASAR